MLQRKHSNSFTKRKILNHDIMERIDNRIRDLRAPEMDFIDMSKVDFTGEGPIDPEYGGGVNIKILDLVETKEVHFKKVEMTFGEESEMFPHFCNSCHEIIEVRQGEIIDKMVNDNYKKGDVYHIKKGIKHHLYSHKGATIIVHYVYNTNYHFILNKLKKLA